MAESILQVKNLHKKFGDVEVLKGVSLTIEEGEVVVIIGSSGTGKSTLLRCINHLTPPDSGIFILRVKIEYKGNNLNQIRQKIGMVFQEFNLFNHLTALQNVAIGPSKVKKINKGEALELARKELIRVGTPR